MPLSRETLKAMDVFLEGIYPESQALGESLARVGLKNTQIRNLETLVASTTRFSEIINFVKNQAGKESGREKKWRQVAPEMLTRLVGIETQAHALGQGDNAAIMEIKLRLARGWAKQVVAHYLYRKPEEGGDD